MTQAYRFRTEERQGNLARSDREADVHDVALPDDVILALDPDEALVLGRLHAARTHQILEGDHFRPDEPTLQVGVDGPGGLGRFRPSRYLPSPRLVLSGREERDEVERPVRRVDHGVEARLVDPELV